jgi:hypothetical protein
MAGPPPLRLPSISKVVALLSVLWALACAAMLLSMHHSSKSLNFLFLLLAIVPIALMWILVFLAGRLEKKTAPREPGRRGDAEGLRRA